MRYPNEPRDDAAWIAEQFKVLRDKIETVERALNVGSDTSGLVVGTASLALGSNIGFIGSPSLVRVQGVVTLVAEFKPTVNLGGDSVLATLPLGFRPVKSTDPDLKCLAVGQVNNLWTTIPCYVRGDQGTLRIQGNQSLASGQQLAIQLSYFALA